MQVQRQTVQHGVCVAEAHRGHVVPGATQHDHDRAGEGVRAGALGGTKAARQRPAAIQTARMLTHTLIYKGGASAIFCEYIREALHRQPQFHIVHFYSDGHTQTHTMYINQFHGEHGTDLASSSCWLPA